MAGSLAWPEAGRGFSDSIQLVHLMSMVIVGRLDAIPCLMGNRAADAGILGI